MKKFSFRPSSLDLFAFAFALGCSSDDGDAASAQSEAGRSPTPGDNAMPAAAPSGSGGQPMTITPSMGSMEGTVEPNGISQPPASDMTAGMEMSGGLQPALPVVENPDHAQLLSSATPELASNKRLVYDMWRTLIDARDTEAAEQYLAEDYIQHNPNVDTGREGVLAFFASLGEPLEVQERVQAKLVAIVAEGDLVVMARVDEYTEPRPYTTTWFDSFRIEDGVIAEHWDHGRLPMGAAPRAYVPPTESPDQEAALASADPELAANKQLVHEMWRTLLDAQQVEEAPRFLAPGYAQHNPLANTGLEGFLAFFRQFAQPREVQPTVANFIHIVAEDDLVVLATVNTYDNASGTPYATTWFDMFRVRDNLLVEHWDTATID